MASIASVTTAYNAAKLLPRQMDGLLLQSRPLQEIIVVDNASRDGTAGLLSERYPNVTVLRMAENLGAAGAWAAGFRYAALQKRHDWIWAFDDDSVPEPETLALLLAGSEVVRAQADIGILAPLPVHKESGTPYPPLLWENGWRRPDPELLRESVWFADLVIASGALVSGQVVEKIGLPRADFFMDFFDYEYCLRARKAGFKIAVVNQAQLGHQIGNARSLSFFGKSRLWPNYPPWREYYVARNMVYSCWHLYPSVRSKRFAVRQSLRHATGVLLVGSKKFASLKSMALGFRDGVMGRLGITVRPGGPQPVGS